MDEQALVEETVRRQLIPESCEEGEFISLKTMEMARIKVPNKVETNTKSAIANLQYEVERFESNCRGKELKDITAASPWFAIVAMVLLHKQIRWARERCVIPQIAIVVRMPFKLWIREHHTRQMDSMDREMLIS
ncbi:hypothetical protein HPP92_028569 [Vanilla planifolia]|uniref:Uncharacterized protein n=1 Tax=Vanilla planifolia TaxID=51239 RepID=A0A835P4S0_VANPL|nr:hypothetical protein HPP92_028569 [Vanilla planifolia]